LISEFLLIKGPFKPIGRSEPYVSSDKTPKRGRGRLNFDKEIETNFGHLVISRTFMEIKTSKGLIQLRKS